LNKRNYTQWKFNHIGCRTRHRVHNQVLTGTSLLHVYSSHDAACQPCIGTDFQKETAETHGLLLFIIYFVFKAPHVGDQGSPCRDSLPDSAHKDSVLQTRSSLVLIPSSLHHCLHYRGSISPVFDRYIVAHCLQVMSLYQPSIYLSSLWRYLQHTSCTLIPQILCCSHITINRL